MKSIIVDASSAILLFKSTLIEPLVDHYNTLVAESVYSELIRDGYPGSNSFKQLHRTNRISVLKPFPAELPLVNTFPALPKLDSGEKDTIYHQLHGKSDFIMIDDGRAVKYCRKAGLPFINALLFPRILLLINAISEADCDRKRQQIIRLGRYSEQIIDMASNLTEKEILRFLPSQ